MNPTDDATDPTTAPAPAAATDRSVPWIGVAVFALGAVWGTSAAIDGLGGGATWLVVAALGALASIGGAVDAVRRRVGIGRLLLIQATCLLLAAAATVLVVTPYVDHEARALLAFGIGVAAGVHALRHTFARVVPKPARSAIPLVTVAAAILVGGGELTLRVLGWWKPSPLFVRRASTPEEILACHRYPPGTLRFGVPMNDAGFYDDPFVPSTPERPSIAVIGDSFSTGIVPHGHHYTTVAERALDAVELLNVGLPRTGPGGYLHLLRTEVWPLNPRAVVVSLYMGNDVAESSPLFETHGVLASWLDRENLLVWQVPARLAKVIRTASAAATEGGRRPGEVQGELGHVDGEVRDPAAIAAAFPWLDDPTLEQGTFPHALFLDVEVERATANRDGMTNGDLDKLLRALNLLAKTCIDRPFLVQIIPDQYQVDDAIWAHVTKTLGDDAPDRDEPQRSIVAHLAGAGIPCLDLLPVFRAERPGRDGQRHLYHLNDTHINARGNAVAGAALADFLADRLDFVARRGAPR